MCSATTATSTTTTTEPSPLQSMANPSPSASLKKGARQQSQPFVTETCVPPPSFEARLLCLSIMLGCFAVWAKYTFIPESAIPGAHVELHSWTVPAQLTVAYLLVLLALRTFTALYLTKAVDVKLLLKEAMVAYNAGQVLLNLWMVYRILDALFFRAHPFICAPVDLVDTGATYAVWVHYCDKYLEFFDTFFMVLRGRMDQVSFLHVYHHCSIAWAWWIGMKYYTGGDIYFGALLNSWIHVMMYSYYTLSLLKVKCPWKRYLTQAQLLQFVSVLVYSVCSLVYMPANASTGHYWAYWVQIFEMVSLFVLFMSFYRKAYRTTTSTPVVGVTKGTTTVSNGSCHDQSKAGATAANGAPHNDVDTTSQSVDSVPEQSSLSSESSLDR